MGRKRLQAILFGPQGCGKGTQGQLLSDRFGIPLFGSGDMFRAEIEANTPLGSLVKEYVARGMLAPDEVVNAIFKKRLKEIVSEKGFLLEGYPRNVDQAESLDRLVKINLAIHIKISDEEAVKRLMGRRQCVFCRSIFHIEEAPSALPGRCALCGHPLIKREDDREDIIRQRLVAYHFMTEPMAAYYRKQGVLLVVNGAQPIPFLFEELIRKMARLGFVA
ncbi:nucleoside monophosphate kinase [Candidatus Uhrbacteria bacterium]|nr:nucleoside monophosphate kinase [Candidatus Uhrbacteria bacterium]